MSCYAGTDKQLSVNLLFILTRGARVKGSFFRVCHRRISFRYESQMEHNIIKDCWWIWYVECAEEMRNEYKILAEKPEEVGPLGRCRCVCGLN